MPTLEGNISQKAHKGGQEKNGEKKPPIKKAAIGIART